MSIGKTYLDIITSEPLIDISTRDIGDHKHIKIKVMVSLTSFLVK
jgi:hypothetical protein